MSDSNKKSLFDDLKESFNKGYNSVTPTDKSLEDKIIDGSKDGFKDAAKSKYGWVTAIFDIFK